MKILFVINSLRTGGAERILSLLANELAPRQHDVSVLTFEAEDRSPAFPLQVPRYNLDSKKSSKILTLLNLPILCYKLRQKIKAINPDVTISFMDQNNILTLISSVGLTGKRIVSERVNPIYSSLSELPCPINILMTWVRNFCYRLADRIVVQTNGAAHYFIQRGFSNTAVIPNPVPAAPSHLNTDKNSTTICSLSRLVPQKRIDLLLTAFSRIAAEFPEWRLAIAGDGPLRTQLETQVKTLRLDSRVIFIGNTNSPYEFLSHAAIFVLCSDFEGFPGALCDAMSMGIPSIATRCPFGPEEIINDRENGLLIPCNDALALAQALKEIISNTALRVQMAQKSVRVTERFNVGSILSMWEEAVLR